MKTTVPRRSTQRARQADATIYKKNVVRVVVILCVAVVKRSGKAK